MPSRAPWPDFDLPSVCPICNAHHEAAANTESQDMPSDGDVSICIVCHGISVYDFATPGKLRFPADAELEVILADPRLAILQAGLRVVKDRLGPLKGDYFRDQD